MTTPFSRALLTLALATALPAWAQSDTAAAQQKALEAARADLQRAAKRLAELSLTSGEIALPIALDARVMGKPRLGVLLAGDDDAGVRITGVTPDSGAAKAGLKAGDRLIRVAGAPITGSTADARVENARAALSTLKVDVPVALSYRRDGQTSEVKAIPALVSPRITLGTPDDGSAFVFRDLDGLSSLDGVQLDRLRTLVAPEVRLELQRLQDCKGEECRLPMLADAFRWNGLNLAPVDARLGRYFGTEHGVLVLGRQPMPQLEPGDVILEIEGKAVDSPQDALRALTARKPGEKASARILRDRQLRTVQIDVPERMSHIEFRPAQGATRGPGTAPRVVTRRSVMTVDGDGNVQTFDEDGPDPVPPAPPVPAVPPAKNGGGVLP